MQEILQRILNHIQTIFEQMKITNENILELRKEILAERIERLEAEKIHNQKLIEKFNNKTGEKNDN